MNLSGPDENEEGAGSGPFGQEPDPAPLEEASENVLQTAEQFLMTVASGDGTAMWEMFTDTARDYIIGLGHERGMDFDLVSRLRHGSASQEELDDFLGDLMVGIQNDLAGLDFSRLGFESKAEPESPMEVRVNYLVSLGPEIEGMQTAIPAGSILLRYQDDGKWGVERLVPRPGDTGTESGGGQSGPGPPPPAPEGNPSAT